MMNSRSSANRIDWPGLMRAGMVGLGLKPWEFWALTPAELALMLGIETGTKMMTRVRLSELTSLYPDKARATAAQKSTGE